MNIAKKFQELAGICPEKDFIIFRDRRISLGESSKKVNALADALVKQGIGKGDKAAVYLPNSPEYIYSYLAVFSVGASCVPLDPRLPKEELIGVLNHAEAAVLITNILKDLSEDNLKEQVSSLKAIISAFPEGIDQSVSSEIDEDSLAILYYTSGTTGKPKAVMADYRSLANAPETIKFAGVTLGDAAICALPFSHLGGFVYLQIALEFKMSIVLMERLVPLEFLRQIEKYKVTWFHLVPAMFNAILQLKEFEKYDLSSVKGVCIFGAPSHPSLIQRFGKYCPNATLWHGWGMSETAAPNTITDPAHIGSIGKPPSWFEVKIVDSNDKEVPQGEIGEIVCRGWPVMKGYYKEPEMTAEIMRNGWLHTGDLGNIDREGYLHIKGRKKDMIIVGGLNVYSPEVEYIITENEKVKEAAVVGVPDKLRGEVVKAVVVLKEGEQSSAQEIRAFCRERLIQFKVPQIIEFRQSLPKTRSGKVQKELLRENAALARDQA